MNILFDINHPVDVNFFKNTMLTLKRAGHNIQIVFRERGKLEKILRFELGDFPISAIGRHKKGFLKKIGSQLYRDFKLISFIKKNRIDLVVCFGSTAAISSWFCNKPYLAFDDDFEYKIPFYHANIFATKHIYPDTIEYSNSKTIKFHGFKELAYLHPNYLKISDEILDKYSLKVNEYVFIREIASVSLNYKQSNSIFDQILNNIREKGLKIVISLERRDLNRYYVDKGCIVLEEPVSDIYSLMHHALFAISSGDTVARETALLGVPTFYTGGREMVVNKDLIDCGAIFDLTNTELIKKRIEDLTIDKKNTVRKSILDLTKNSWDDTNEVILTQIYSIGQ